MLEQRQMAERCRVAGNEAYKAGQWTVAYGHYELGLVSQRTNVKLQSNAAMASLKMGCHVQAIEHCDRVIRLLDYLLDKPDDPLVTKALQRRATACSALRMYKEAVVVRTPGNECWTNLPPVGLVGIRTICAIGSH